MRESVARVGRGPQRVVLTALGVTLGLLGTTGVAAAHFVDGDSASLSVSTAILEPPTAPGTSPGDCTSEGDAIVVTWTASTSAVVTGYEILRSTASGGPFSVVGTATGNATQTFTDSPLAFSTTYYYVVRAVKDSWRSPETSTVSRTTRSSLCV